ncbi:complex I NDUFA9 subunit family protein [Deinococcus pimensis]|uniref:complex I NDUFA9 subunit family protein n=1 Tax=Deinococcus pimensis TaxID=309888 RepID=UPI0004AD5F40|nr:complex I NDUFA9 subunit family protein [Deinococcus pimensis]
MRILVTGGSGFVGRAVVQQLVADGHDVRVGSRGGKGPTGAPGVPLDITDPASVERAVRHARPDAIVHLVGIIAQKGRQTFERVHVEGTRHVIAAAPAGTRLIHMSALGAREDSRSRYSSSKARAERLVRESGLPATIFEPSLIFGPGDDFFGRVLKNLVSQAPVVPVIGDGAFPFRPVSVHDVALAFSRALKRPDTAGRTFVLTGPREYRFDELLKLELAALGKRKRLVRVPLALMNLAVPAMRILPNPPITTDQYAMLVEGNTADPEPARGTFDLPMLRLEDELPVILGTARQDRTAGGQGVPGDRAVR